MKAGIRLVLAVVLVGTLGSSLLAAPSLDIQKPPVQPVPSWTGPFSDPHALQGQWFVDRATMELEEFRTHEFHDNVETFGGGVMQHLAIEGHVDPASVVYGAAGGPSAGNIVAFNIIVTVTNDTPGDWNWADGTNSHDETLVNQGEQYEGTLYDAKITAEFSVDPILMGPGPAVLLPYLNSDPEIVAQNHQQLGWYCWTPENPDPEKQTSGWYLVPTWDLGDIPVGQSATTVMMFSVSGPGLAPAGVGGDIRGFVIENSVQTGADVLSNRTTSLKISTWVDILFTDAGTPYLHDVDPGLPLRSSDCSVFHNIQGLGGLSLDIRKPPVTPNQEAWTGPPWDPDAVQGQWFFDMGSGNTEVRSHEFYDPVHELPDMTLVDGSAAITGVVDPASIVISPANGNITAFEIDATVTNNTPWPYPWADGSNSHNELLSTRAQYEGTLWQTKLTADFAVDPGILPSGNYPYVDRVPHIVAQNHTQLGWYCWAEDNPDQDKQESGNFQVPTWDLGDIPQGQSATVRMRFTVDGGGIPSTDPRYAVITQAQDVFLNRETSLKISTWVDELAADTGQPFPVEPPMRSSDVSVFHNAEPPQLAVGLSLDIRKPPFNGPVMPLPSWTGPMNDPHALRGQWFMGLDGIETVRTHEYHDPAPGDELPTGDVIPLQLPVPLPAGGAIYGFCKNVVYDASGLNIVSFEIEATVTNLTPYPEEYWLNGDNSHDEWSQVWWQYEGPLLQTKLTAEFAIDQNVGPPPAGIPYPPYRDISPRVNIVAANHNQLAWYCWAPENPEGLQPIGNYSVPTWDFGDIQQGQSVTVTMQFTVDGGGLPATDSRHGVIVSSDANHTDVLCNRTTSLKVSTWVDELTADPGTPYPHHEGDGLPLRSSDCSVFHNTADEEDIGGLSLPIVKPPVMPGVSWTGPLPDPHAWSGQWFMDRAYGLEDWRTHEFHDNVTSNNPYFRPMGSAAIYGRVSNLVQDPTSGNILSFDVEAFITNHTPFPDEWIEGDNSHGETADPRDQYAGVLYDTKLAIEFAFDPAAPPPAGAVYPPYRVDELLFGAVNHDQLGWYCWNPEADDPIFLPSGDYHVPTWDFGDIGPGMTGHRTLSFVVAVPGGLPASHSAYHHLVDSNDYGDDILLNRSTSLKISTWIDDVVRDWGLAYPHQNDQPPLRSSNCSVFHDTAKRLRIVAALDYDWVYQNTPITTQWRHESICTITAVREVIPGEAYTLGIQENGGALTNFALGVVNQAGNVVTVEIDGALMTSSTPSPAGGPPYTMTVSLSGSVSGWADSTSFPLTLRRLGDVNGDGVVDTSDKLEINRYLNGIPTTATFRELDLTGDGVAVDTNDKLQVNRVLNGIPVP